MFGFSHLPYSTSDTVFFNGEVFRFILNAGILQNLPFYVEKEISFILNIQQDSVIILCKY